MDKSFKTKINKLSKETEAVRNRKLLRNKPTKNDKTSEGNGNAAAMLRQLTFRVILGRRHLSSNQQLSSLGTT